MLSRVAKERCPGAPITRPGVGSHPGILPAVDFEWKPDESQPRILDRRPDRSLRHRRAGRDRDSKHSTRKFISPSPLHENLGDSRRLFSRHLPDQIAHYGPRAAFRVERAGNRDSPVSFAVGIVFVVGLPQVIVAAVTERLVLGMLAATKQHLRVLPGCDIPNRRELRALMGLITERLVLAQAAAAPQVRLARLKLLIVGLVAGDTRQHCLIFTHVFSFPVESGNGDMVARTSAE